MPSGTRRIYFFEEILMRTMTHETKKPCTVGKKKEQTHKTYGYDSLCQNGAEGLEDVR